MGAILPQKSGIGMPERKKNNYITGKSQLFKAKGMKSGKAPVALVGIG